MLGWLKSRDNWFSDFHRWVKFEEKVEEGGERWSKPHVSTLTLHSLFELRTCLQTGSILLDLEGYSLPQIVGEPPLTLGTGWKRAAPDKVLNLRKRPNVSWHLPHSRSVSDDIVDRQIEDGLIPPELKEKISFVLLRKHRHQTKKPIHRSLADLGKSSNAPSSMSVRCFPAFRHLSDLTPSNLCLWNHLCSVHPFSSAGVLSDRSPQANLNRSTSSTTGVHRSTEDLRSWQSSSLGRLRKSAPTNRHIWDFQGLINTKSPHEDSHDNSSHEPRVIN